MVNSNENQPSKESQKSNNTPSRSSRDVATDVSEAKVEKEETKELPKVEPCKETTKNLSTQGTNNKDGFETPRSNLSKHDTNNIESPMQFKDTDNQLDTSLKEEIEDYADIEVIMYILFEESRHLFKKSQADKVIKINIADLKLAEFLETSKTEIRGCRI